MERQVRKPLQRKKTAKSGHSSVGDNDDIAALLHNSQSSHAATQVSSIRALQPHIGNQAILRLIAQQSRVNGTASSPRIERMIQREETTPVKAEEQEEDEFETVDLTTDIEDVDTDGETDSDEETSNSQVNEKGSNKEDVSTKSQVETDSETLPSNSQIISNSMLSNKDEKKTEKLGIKDRAIQLLPGKSLKETQLALTEAGTSVKDFIIQLVSLGIDKLLVKGVEMVVEALSNSDLVQQAIDFVMNTFGPIYETFSNLIEPLSNVLDIVGEIIPFAGSILGFGKSILGTIGGLIKAVKRGLFAKKLGDAMSADSETVNQVANYGLSKVLRSVIERLYETGRSLGLMFRSIANIALDIASCATEGAAQGGKIVTLALSGADALLNVVVKGSRVVKGGLKTIMGTRGVARKQNATKLVEAAIEGDSDAQDLIINMGSYSMFERIERSRLEGQIVILDNIVQPLLNETGLKKTEANEITLAFFDWGKDKLDDFYKWLKSKFSLLKEKGIIKLVIDLLKDMLNFRKEEAKEELLEDIKKYGSDKKHPWKKALIKHIAAKFKSS